MDRRGRSPHVSIGLEFGEYLKLGWLTIAASLRSGRCESSEVILVAEDVNLPVRSLDAWRFQIFRTGGCCWRFTGTFTSSATRLVAEFVFKQKTEQEATEVTEI
jgi:hypothetical protein